MADKKVTAQIGSFALECELDDSGRLVLRVDSFDGTEVFMVGEDKLIAVDGRMILTTEAISLAGR